MVSPKNQIIGIGNGSFRTYPRGEGFREKKKSNGSSLTPHREAFTLTTDTPTTLAHDKWTLDRVTGLNSCGDAHSVFVRPGQGGQWGCETADRRARGSPPKLGDMGLKIAHSGGIDVITTG